jgi:hypothetical protein
MKTRLISELDALNRSIKRLLLITLLLLIGVSLIGSCGCASVKVISADREIQRLQKNNRFVAPHDGWFVPDATWKDINEALADKL